MAANLANVTLARDDIAGRTEMHPAPRRSDRRSVRHAGMEFHRQERRPAACAYEPGHHRPPAQVFVRPNLSAAGKIMAVSSRTAEPIDAGVPKDAEFLK
ncbi:MULTISPECIES: hypothetical protein [unclassified Mesorhizobium]|uniref:hypothetical protein n=1 Tax=unclassified Mesorhizobium TaxID=325217 RepID=UPI001CC9301F|nr:MULTISPECIES: hypothetical protein [unclassified Mesorhizobium]